MSKNLSHLINTSIDDMKASLDCAECNNEPYSIQLLKEALRIAERRKEKTRIKILAGKIRRYERAARQSAS